MKLRDYQKKVTAAASAAMDKHGNTMIVAPTGAGKTVLMAAQADALSRRLGRPAKILTIQHRSELIDQNMSTFTAFTGRTDTGIIQASQRDWSAGASFGMIQTIANNLDDMPSDLDAIFIDECHHVAAQSYLDTILEAQIKNTDTKLFGVTATPMRGDRRGLGKAFSNCSGIVDINDLISTGILVRPRVMVQDVGVSDDLAAAGGGEWGDQRAVARVMMQQPVAAAVLDTWREKAGDRTTVFFCPDVESSEQYASFFSKAGVTATSVHSRLTDRERARRLSEFKAGRLQVLFNPMLLTEGFDHQPVGCVGLLRKSSQKSTLVQMVGRGLRSIDPSRFPDMTKDDCIILDFGASFIKHGDLFVPVDLEGKEPGAGQAPQKDCPVCNWSVPLASRECPNCGHAFPVRLNVGGAVAEVTLIEKEILRKSPYKWTDIEAHSATVANAGKASAYAVQRNGAWHAFGSTEPYKIEQIHTGTRESALAAADIFLTRHGDPDFAGKQKSWLSRPPSDKQLEILTDRGLTPAPGERCTRYQASCRMSFAFNRSKIERLLPIEGQDAT